MDHAGLPLKTVLEQLDMLGEEVVPVLRKEFAALRPAHVPGRADPRRLLAAATPRRDRRPRLPTPSGAGRVDRAGHAGRIDDRSPSRSSRPVSASRRRPGCWPTASPRRPRQRLAQDRRVEVRRGGRTARPGRDIANNLLTGFPRRRCRRRSTR